MTMPNNRGQLSRDLAEGFLGEWRRMLVANST
jgi:hypothetical protein